MSDHLDFIPLDLRKCGLVIVITLDFYEFSLLIVNMIL